VLRYRLYAVRIFVTDWQRAVDFYRYTLDMPLAYDSEEQGWAELAVDGAHLALDRAEPGDADLVGRFVGASLQVPDVAATYQLLRTRGVEFLGPPEKQEWGGTLAHFKDPDGNVLTLLGAS
jgi:catechol 2,3-dioxygenase-like lactoylglutathione lyase family enzyme